MEKAGKNLKICFACPSYYETRTGGAELTIKYLSDYFRDHGYTVCFVTQGDNEEVCLSKRGDRVIRYRRHRWICGDNYRSMYRALAKANADVYYQRITSVLTLSTSMFCQVNNRLAIWAAAHNDDCIRFRHLKELFLKGKFKRFNVKGKLHAVARLLVKDLAYHWGIRWADSRIVQMADQQNLLASSFGLDSELLYKGYPLMRHTSSDDATAERCGHVVWIANLRDWKRPEIYLDLARRLARADRRFLLIGAPYRSPDKQQSFEQEVERISHADYVGRVSHDEVLAYLAQARLLVHTSPSEGLSNVFIEAWMNRTPVLSYQFNPDDIIERYGVGAVADDFSELVRLADAFLEGRRQVEDEAFEAVLELFDLEKHGDRLRALIEEKLEGGLHVEEMDGMP